MTYSGSLAEATIDTDSLPRYTQDLFATLFTIDNLKMIVPVPLDTPPSSMVCATDNPLEGSGSANIVHKENPDGSGYGYASYNNYLLTLSRGQSFILNGGAYATFPSTPVSAPQSETVSFINFHVAAPGYIDVILNGTIKIEAAANTPLEYNYGMGGSINANLIIVDNLHQSTLWANNFSYNDNPDPSLGTQFVDRDVSGNLYDEQFGYAQLATIDPVAYSFQSANSKQAAQTEDGGPLKFSGGTASVGYFIPLSLTLDALALDDAGNGTWDKTERIDAGKLVPDTTAYLSLPGPIPMAAVSNASTTTETNPPLQVEGLRSYSPAGGFITYHWTLLAGPSLSSATLSNPDSAIPGFTPSSAGTYLLQLTVSDGQTSNTQDVTVTAGGNSVSGITINQRHAVVGPDMQAHVGQTITADGRASIGINTGTWAFEWALATPPGSNAKLTYTGPFAGSGQQTKTSFVPDVPGFYTLVLEETDINGFYTSGNPATQIIAVDTGLDFHPPATLVDSSTYPFGFKYAVGDFNNDGIMDVATFGKFVPTSGLPDEELNLFYGSKQGGLSSPRTMKFTGLVADSLIAADINDDGRTDLVMYADGVGPFAILQKSDGTMSSPVQIGSSSSCITGTSPLQLAGTGPWKSGTAISIYTDLGSCLDIYQNTSSTSFSSAATETSPFSSVNIYPYTVQIADVTGDGIPDILGLHCPGSSSALEVFPGQADGSFGSAISYGLPNMNLFEPCYPFVLGDLNHDGLSDIAALDGDAIDLFLQNGSGAFASASHPAILAPPGYSGFVTGDLTGGDINGDGRDDLLIHHFHYAIQDPADTNVYITPTYLGILLQNSSGSFGSEWVYPLSQNWNTSVSQSSPMTVGDFNGDGLPDLITFDGSGNLMVVYQKPYK
jgi:hypothetical protein